MTRPQTPFGIALLATWDITIGSLGLVFTATLALLGAFLTIGGMIVFAFTMVWLVSGFSVITKKSWAWKLGLISSSISLIGSLTLWLLAFLFLEFFGPGVFFWPLILYYLTRPGTKNFLNKAPRTPP